MTTYLENLREGSEYLSAARTIRTEDITAFAELSGDFSPLHTDDEWVRKNTPFSSRIAHGALIFSISQGLRTPVIDDIAVIAFLGFERTLVGPVYPGDTVTARWTVSQVRRSRSSPDRGIACLQVAVINQDGTIVQRGSDTYLAAARPAGAGQNLDDWPELYVGAVAKPDVDDSAERDRLTMTRQSCATARAGRHGGLPRPRGASAASP